MDKNVLRLPRGAVVHRGVGLFFDSDDDHAEAVGACGVEEEKREAAVAGDEAEGVHAASRFKSSRRPRAPAIFTRESTENL